ncbi:acetyl-CoA acetyltransferase [Corynebacterium sp. S7]
MNTTMTTQSSTRTPQFSSPITKPDTRDALQIRFGTDRALPKELREESAGMNWHLFAATYAPNATLQISYTGSKNMDLLTSIYSAEITEHSKTEPPHTFNREIKASGPASAFSHMLADAGRHIEILKFHQIELFEATVTIIKAAHQVDEERTAWAIGFGATSEASIAHALSSGAQRIYG